MTPRQTLFNFGWAWVAVCLALAVHIADEATTAFLSTYNPTVLAIRRRLPLLPLPTFTFKVWLSGLVVAVALLLSLSLFAFRGVKWMTVPAYALGFVMTANAVLHIASSIYMGRLMPGFYSSPLLFISSIYLLLAATARLFSQTK